VTFTAISRTLLAEIEAYKKRMGCALRQPREAWRALPLFKISGYFCYRKLKRLQHGHPRLLKNRPL
jgi:hypothetical protein